MSSKFRQKLNYALFFICGGVIGAYVWQQVHFAPLAAGAIAGNLSTEINSSVATLQMLDRNKNECARNLIASSLKSSLEIVVPSALQWQMDAGFSEYLRKSAQDARLYLADHPVPQTSGGECAK